MTRLAIAAALLCVSACGPGDAPSGDRAESTGTPNATSAAGAASAQAVTAACLESSSESAEICACIGERAVTRLDDRQVAFLVAYLSGDTDAEAMGEELGMGRATQALTVLSTDSASCEPEGESE